MKKFKFYLIIVFLCIVSAAYTQQISINLNGNAGNAAAILDLSDASNSSLGFLLPNVSLTNITQLTPLSASSPVGLMVFNTNTSTSNGLFGPGVYYWNGSSWSYISNSGNSLAGAFLTAGNGIEAMTFDFTSSQTVELINGTATGQTFVTNSSNIPTLQTMQQDAVIGSTGNVTVQGILGFPIVTPLVNNGVLIYNSTNSNWVPTDITSLGNYVFNQTGVQSAANFNIGANGIIGGTLNVAGLSTFSTLTSVGNASINGSGTGTTTIGTGTTTVTEKGTYTLNGSNGAATTNIGTGSTTGNVSIGGASNNVLLPAITANNAVLYTSAGNGTIASTGAPAATNNVLYYNGTNPVWGTLPSGLITATNGLTMSTATNAILGGTLTQATAIAQAGKSIDISGGDIGLNDGTSSSPTNINTGTSTGAVNIGNGTNTAIAVNGNYTVNGSNGAATTKIGTGSTTGNVTIGNSNNSILLPAFYQVGDLPYINSTGGNLNMVTPTSSSTFQVLTQKASAVIPAWQSLGAISALTSVTASAPITASISVDTLKIAITTPLAINYGGTGGNNAPISGGVVYGTSLNIYGFTPTGILGNVLLSNGSAPPTWGTTVSNVVTANNGITFVGTDAQLGGSLIQNSTIANSNYTLSFDLGTGSTAGTGKFIIQNGGSSNPYLVVDNSGGSGNPVQVGIGTSSPNADAALDITSTTGGMLPPRLTQTEISAIAAPVNGLLVYNTTTNCMNVYSGGWVAFACVASTCGTLPSQPSGLGTTTTSYCGSGGTETFTLTPGSNQTSTVWTIAPSGTVGTNSETSASITIPSTVGSYTITATPENANSCSGPAATLVVTVANTPTVTSTSEAICSGASVAYNITSNPGGASFSWIGASNANVYGITTTTQNNATIPDNLSLAYGITTPQTVTYSITPVIGSCTGATATLTVTVNPVPTVTSVTVDTVCSGIAGSYTITTDAPSNFTWTASPLPAYITSGGATSGTTSVIAINLTNLTSSPINVTYTIIPTATSGGCTGSPFYLTVTVNPGPVGTSGSTGICTAGSFTYTPTSTPSGTYSWTASPLPSNITNADPNTGTGNIIGALSNSSTNAINVIYTITPTSTNGCVGAAYYYTVAVTPAPTITSSLTGIACSGTALPYTINSNLSGASYSWSRNSSTSASISPATSSGSSNSINEVVTNSSTAPVNITYTITATYGTCSSTTNYVVTVEPTATITTTPNPATVCNGGTVSTTFTSTNATTYNWTGNYPAGVTGSVVSATGVAIASPLSEVLTSTLTTAATVTYSVTPYNNGSCAGTTYTYSVNVEPTPAITTATTSYTVCNNGTLTTSAFTSANATTYNWIAPTISGFSSTPASANGVAIGNTFSTVVTNTTTAAITATYTITPFNNSGGCTGSTFTIAVVVEPTPTVTTAITSYTVCNGGTLTTSAFTSSANNATTYNWIAPTISGFSSTPASANGVAIGNTFSTVVTNTTTAAITATYTITPFANGTCSGTTFTIAVVVEPTPTITTSTTTYTICNGGTLTTSAFTASANNSTTYSWAAPTVSGFSSTPSSGSGVAIGNTFSTVVTNTTTAALTATYTITPFANGTCSGTTFTIAVVVEPTPTVTTSTTSYTVCNGGSFTTSAFTSSANNTTTYNWVAPAISGFTSTPASGSGVAIGGTFSAVVTNSNTSGVNATYTITPIANGTCAGTTFTINVLVEPTPTVTTATNSYTISCTGTQTLTPTNFTSSNATTYSWAQTLPTGVTSTPGSGTTGLAIGGTFTETFTSTASTPQNVTYTVTPFVNGTCSGTPINFTVTVNPSYTVTTTPTTFTVCNGGTLTTSTFTSGNATTYNWIAPTISGFSSTPSTASGVSIGNTFSAVVTNTTTTAINAVYTITPVNSGCSGAPFTISVLAEPAPTVSITPNPGTVCSGTAFTSPALTSNASTYNWTEALPTGVTGGTPASGVAIGTPISATWTNTLTTAATVTITITPLIGSCTGTAFSYSVTVSPVPAAPAAAGCTTTGTCIGTSYTYTCSTVTGATSYKFTFPAGVSSTNPITSATPTVTATFSCLPTTLTGTVVAIVGTCTSPGRTFAIPTGGCAAVADVYNGPTGYTGGALAFQTWVVPCGVTSIHIVAAGASGQPSGDQTPGAGAVVTQNVTVVAGQTLDIVCGGAGQVQYSDYAGGGGGGSFVWSTSSTTYPLVAAGGGGGGGYSSAGSPGSTTTAATAPTSGGAGGTGGLGGGGGTATKTGPGGGGAGWIGNGVAGAGTAVTGGQGGYDEAGNFVGGASNTDEAVSWGGFGGGGGGGYNTSSTWGAGGGGGGYNGGGGGTSTSNTVQSGGGGGGSGYYNGAYPYTNAGNFVSPTSVTQSNSGTTTTWSNGYVNITY